MSFFLDWLWWSIKYCKSLFGYFLIFIKEFSKINIKEKSIALANFQRSPKIKISSLEIKKNLEK